MTDTSREKKLRRTAERRGYRAMKSHQRDKLAVNYGKWQLTRIEDVDTKPIGSTWLTLVEAEEWLSYVR